MQINALVRLWFYLVLAVSLLLSSSWLGWSLFLVITIFLICLNRTKIGELGHRLLPYFYFLPVMVILYTCFSVLLTSDDLSVILLQGLFGFAKLILTITVMTIYFLRTSEGDILYALRSLAHKTGRSWRFVEDFFLFLELTLRFFPAFQRDWDQLREARQALGITASQKRWDIIRSTAADLPALLLRNIGRADEIAHTVVLRGYGQQIPRGITYPVRYTYIDLVEFLTITIVAYLVNFHAAL